MLKLIAIGSALAAVPAAAQKIEVEAVPSVEVSFADLNVGSETGRALLDARLRSAARGICRPETLGAVRERMDRRACYRTALTTARGQAAQLFAQHDTARLAARLTITVAAR